MARDPGRRIRRDRRLQGSGAGPPRHRRWPRRARGPDARQPAVRRPSHVRGRDRRARARRRVRARPGPRRLSRASRRRRTTRSRTSSWSAAPTCSASRRRRPTRSRSSPHGLADNLLTSAALACTAPLVVAPAMNNHMYEHPATQANLELLRARGATIVEPGTGRLASRGEWGVGRLAEPGADPRGGRGPARQGCAPRSLDGLRVLVTAGGTREPIDSVRYVGNRSSGRMGLALAAEAARRGAEVTLVAANVDAGRAGRRRVVEVETAAELRGGPRGVRRRATCCSWPRPWPTSGRREEVEDKITKSGRDGLALALEPTEDVLAALAASARPGPDAGRLRRRARRGSRRARAREARAQGPRRRGGERHLAPRDRLRRARQRGHDRARRTGERHVPRGRRRRSPPRSSTRSRGCGHGGGPSAAGRVPWGARP